MYYTYAHWQDFIQSISQLGLNSLTIQNAENLLLNPGHLDF
jgi:hypothetical protein